MAVARSSAPSLAVERVTSFLTGLGHGPQPALAMAGNLLGESVDPRVGRRFGSLTMTPDERERFAHTLQSRRVILEGTLLSLTGGDVREGAVLSAHALCETVNARRPVALQIGGARAGREQITAACSRLQGELDSIDALMEATVEAGTDEMLTMGVGGGKPHPRVVHLQNRLNALGHRVATDGKFGEVTREAVKDFQAKAGLDPSGEVDEDTHSALRHGRQVVEVGPAAMLPQADANGKPLTPIGTGDPNKETGNSASQKPPVSLSKRVQAIAGLLKGLEGLQEKDFTAERQARIEKAEADLEEAVLTADTRGNLGDSDFALPGRRYPIHDRGHAANALARVAQHGSPDEVAKVRAAVKRKYPNMPSLSESHDGRGAPLSKAEEDERRKANGEWEGKDKRKRDLADIAESAQTATLSVTHAPIGKGGTNWITKSKPGNTGQLPAYIQNVRNAIMRGGKSESEATGIAIGRIRDWAGGAGGVSAEVKAAAAKAIAEWEAMKGAAHAKHVAEADTKADYPETMMPSTVKCPECGAHASADAAVCARGHSMRGSRKLLHALIESSVFMAELEMLLRECDELRESWDDFDAQRHKGSWHGLVKAGPMPGESWKDSPGRGPTGKVRNFKSMSPTKLAATLDALKVHGEDHEAHHAAMVAASEKLGTKMPSMPRAPASKPNDLFECAVCGALASVSARVCQRGHRLEEAWSPQARAAAVAARRAGSFKVGDHVAHDAGENTGTVVAKDATAVHIAPDHPGNVDWDAIEHGQHPTPRVNELVANYRTMHGKEPDAAAIAGLTKKYGTQKTLSYAHDAPMTPVTGSFKPRPPQALKLRGQGGSS